MMSIFGIGSIFIILLIILNQQKDRKDFTFVISYDIFNNIITNYIEIIFIPKVNYLKTIYNLDKDSKVNSIKSFNEEIDKIISESVKEIIQKYTSKKCLKSLLKYHNINGLSIIIALQLKKVI